MTTERTRCALLFAIALTTSARGQGYTELLQVGSAAYKYNQEQEQAKRDNEWKQRVNSKLDRITGLLEDCFSDFADSQFATASDMYTAYLNNSSDAAPLDSAAELAGVANNFFELKGKRGSEAYAASASLRVAIQQQRIFKQTSDEAREGETRTLRELAERLRRHLDSMRDALVAQAAQEGSATNHATRRILRQRAAGLQAISLMIANSAANPISPKEQVYILYSFYPVKSGVREGAGQEADTVPSGFNIAFTPISDASKLDERGAPKAGVSNAVHCTQRKLSKCWGVLTIDCNAGCTDQMVGAFLLPTARSKFYRSAFDLSSSAAGTVYEVLEGDLKNWN